MRKGLKLTLLVGAGYLGISLLHLWLNIGFDKLGFAASRSAEAPMRVGFLPVT